MWGVCFSCGFLANTSTQTMGPRPTAAAAAATPAVRTVPQYKYAAGVRNPQQHLNAQPQVTMQQVWTDRFLHKRDRTLVVITELTTV